ncbi:MAG: uridine kinase [Proteobacteria bacterium]|nr:uridine kinase [Pseudomonadota bacterium]
MMRDNRYVLGICGGSGSGKSYMASQIKEKLAVGSATILNQDSYYRDLSHLAPLERTFVNFDHPDSIDFRLLADHLELLINGVVIEKPIYDYNSHTSLNSCNRILPAPIIIIEGHHVFCYEHILNRIDYKVFLDIEMDIRFIRRLERDINERGRDVASIIKQYLDTVRPMDVEFIQPEKTHADCIITNSNYEDKLSEIVQLLETFITTGKVLHE